MLQSPPRLLAGLLTTSAVVSIALAWSGWLLVEQQRDLDGRLATDRAEAAATAMAANIREKLADLGDQLAARLSPPAPSAGVPSAATPPGLVIVIQRSPDVEVQPDRALPFGPAHPAPPSPSPLFDVGEAAEFSVQSLRVALDAYARLTDHPDPSVRAGALLRVGRVLRKIGGTDESVRAYERLSALGDLPVDSIGVPASLVALDGQRLAYRQIGDTTNEQRLAEEIRRRLDDGEWRLARGLAEFYRDEVSKTPRPETWELAAALSDSWPANPSALAQRGHAIVAPADRSVLVVWRSDGANIAMAAAWLEEFVAAAADSHATWQLVDGDDHLIAGHRSTAPTAAISRVIAGAGPAWTLRLWSADVPASASGRGPVLLAVFLAMLFFVWGATYFMARAIRLEAEVSRLQSDFVAAVSHEFRTPLSTMRQMTEMLVTDRVPGHSRRQRYYGVLAGETARLQRLVETLLNFGRLEAGGKPYRFDVLDVTTLVDSVVSETRNAPHPGRHIVTELSDSSLRVHGDEDAVRLAVRNLVDNAIKYSPPDSSVRVSVTSDGHWVAIAVTDEGPGIAPNEQQAIFRKFVRGRAARDGRVPGTGVGLAIVQRIASAHDGEIRLTSEPGRGSMFTLLLPSLGTPDLTEAGSNGLTAFAREHLTSETPGRAAQG